MPLHFPGSNHAMSSRFSYSRDRSAMNRGSHLDDPFAINPIRRSATIVVLSAVTLFGPFMISPDVGEGMMLSVGGLAATGIIFCVPILIWSVVEEIVRIAQRRMYPPVDVLDLHARIVHNLQRHGYATVRSVDQEGDTSLLLLSNMEASDVREIRRAINLWKYARWQAQGFPATGIE